MGHRIQQLHQHLHIPRPKQQVKQPVVNFKDVLHQVQDVKISKHAEQRLIERNIQIDDKQWKIIGEKMNEAKEKGVKDSLVVMDKAALLVSTENHTIVTAMDRAEATSRVFTNINGTILINE